MSKLIYWLKTKTHAGVAGEVHQALQLLPRKVQRRFGLLVGVQMLTAFLDLAGVLLVTVVGVLALSSVSPGTAVPAQLQSLVNLGTDHGLDINQITIIAAYLAAFFLIAKSVLGSLLTRRALRFLANQQAALSVSLASRLLCQPITVIQERHSMTTAYAVVQGATSAIVGILGSAATIVTESTLLIIFGITLFVINPILTLIAMGFLAAVGLVLQLTLGGWSARVGAINARTAIRGNTVIQETLGSYREISVSNRMGLYAQRIRELVIAGAHSQADGAFIGQVPKFVFESTLVVGAVILATVQVAISDTVTAIGTMVLFLASGSRVLPSIMRLQTSFITIKSASGGAGATFELARTLQGSTAIVPDPSSIEELCKELNSDYDDFLPSIDINRVEYVYPGGGAAALKDISLHVEAGSSLALVGSTGAGKSTLADIMLGILAPSAGGVELGGRHPHDATRIWPGAVAYVPQQVMLVDGTVRDNVALGLPAEVIEDDRIWQALQDAHLADFLRDSREGLDTVIGERGVRLSGGQRQRLGLARALFTRPKILVLDEATSALDAQTEVSISRVINELHGKVTVVVVAHRLATVREFDQIAYLEHGQLMWAGRFEEVRLRVPEFDAQARILGL